MTIRQASQNVLLLIGLVLAACESPAPGTAGLSEPPEVVVMATSEAPRFALADAARMIDEAIIERMELVPAVAEVENPSVLTAEALDTAAGGRILFAGLEPNALQLAVGDVLVSGETDRTPLGLLRKVTAVSVTSTGTEIVTEQAQLEDVIQDGEIIDRADLVLGPGPSVVQHPSGGLLQVLPAPPSAEITFSFHDVVLDLDQDASTTGDQMTASGQVKIRPSYDLRVQIQAFQVKRIEFNNKTTIESSLEIASQYDLVNFNASVPVFDQPFQPRTVTVGGLPVVLTPRLTVRVGVSGEVSVGLQAGITHEAALSLGVEFDSGQWTFPRDLDHSFRHQAPALRRNASARAYLRPRLEIMIFGVVGPFAQMEGYLSLSIDPFVSPWWTLRGGVEAGVGVEFRIFKFLEVSEVQQFRLFDEVIAQAPTDQAGTMVIYDLVGQAALARWSSGAGFLAWDGSETDRSGFVKPRFNVSMEDGAVYDYALQTHPEWVSNGFVYGFFTDIFNSGYKVQDDDVFVASVGFMENALAGDAVFRVFIRPEGAPDAVIAEVADSYDGVLQPVHAPLGAWAGRRAEIILQVDAGPDPAQDWATWVVAQIERLTP